MGKQAADLVQSMVQSASHRGAGVTATVIGIVVLLVTATGVFSELQADLNAIWKAEASTAVVSAMVKTRALGLGLVAALGFMLLVSLVISAGLTALSQLRQPHLPRRGGAVPHRELRRLVRSSLP